MNAPSAVKSHGTTQWIERSKADDRAVPRHTFGKDKENRDLRSKARVSSLRLGPVDRADLEYLWHAYEADLGRRSIHGSVTARLLRSPPNDTARALVLAELGRSGRVTRQKLKEIVVGEGLATGYELRRAIDALIGMGQVETHEGVLALAIAPGVRGRLPTREERWAAEDAELEASCQMIAVKDNEAPAHTDVKPWTSGSARRTLAALMAIRPSQAIALRRFYGERDPSARYDAFGELAPLADLTARVRAERAWRIEEQALVRLEHAIAEAGKTQRDWELELGRTDGELDRAHREDQRWHTARTRELSEKAERAHELQQRRVPAAFLWSDVDRAIRRGLVREITASSVLHELLDTPKSPGRAAFVTEVKTQAEEILIQACTAYREARRRK